MTSHRMKRHHETRECSVVERKGNLRCICPCVMFKNHLANSWDILAHSNDTEAGINHLLNKIWKGICSYSLHLVLRYYITLALPLMSDVSIARSQNCCKLKNCKGRTSCCILLEALELCLALSALKKNCYLWILFTIESKGDLEATDTLHLSLGPWALNPASPVTLWHFKYGAN